jgi:hypothetical protein
MSEFQFVICINNDSNPASLILGRVYRTLPDAEAELHNMLRVIDEDKSEPDGYLYPASMFAPVELPEVAERVLMAAADWLNLLVHPEAIIACQWKPDQGKAQDAAPHFSSTGTGGGEESREITYMGMWTWGVMDEIGFEILSDISGIETIAAGRGVYIRRYLERTYGKGRWRKMKGIVTVQLADGTICEAEMHWFEAHGIGRKDFKIKRVIRWVSFSL